MTRIKRFGLRIEPAVFFPSALVIVGLMVVISLAPGPAGAFLAAMQDGITANAGWFYIFTVTGFLAFVAWLGFSRYDSVKLGRDAEEPEDEHGTGAPTQKPDPALG